MNDNVLAITVTCLKPSVEKLKGKSAKTILEAAMLAAQNDNNVFLLRDDEDRIRAAIATALLVMTDEDRERVKKELRWIKSINAAIEGVPVSFSTFEADDWKPIGINKLWEESKKAYSKKTKK